MFGKPRHVHFSATPSRKRVFRAATKLSAGNTKFSLPWHPQGRDGLFWFSFFSPSQSSALIPLWITIAKGVCLDIAAARNVGEASR